MQGVPPTSTPPIYLLPGIHPSTRPPGDFSSPVSHTSNGDSKIMLGLHFRDLQGLGESLLRFARVRTPLTNGHVLDTGLISESIGRLNLRVEWRSFLYIRHSFPISRSRGFLSHKIFLMITPKGRSALLLSSSASMILRSNNGFNAKPTRQTHDSVHTSPKIDVFLTLIGIRYLFLITYTSDIQHVIHQVYVII
ncbi:hypothetical protein AAMO2058_000155100 [Amorphochlora amoebiformis]